MTIINKATYLSDDTIAAISSALGGAVAILRISGPSSFKILAQLTSKCSPNPAINSQPRKLHLARIGVPESNPFGSPPCDLDEVLFVRFDSPGSFTGEDVVELHLHGGAYVASRTLEAVLSLGARQALAGEFSFRAVRNGKMSLNQATAIADLIAASNDGAISLALEKLSGTQNRLLSAVSQDLKTLAALGEVGIDFSDQDVEEVALPSLRLRLSKIITTLERLRDSYGRGLRLQEGVAVSFVGLPNAGKSSFFNALLGEDRSIVSDVPGTTRDVIREKITLRDAGRSVTLRLEDTAGLRSTHDRIEQIGIERSRKSATEADLLFFIVDPTAPVLEHRRQWQAIGAPRDKSIGVVTKIDLMSQSSLSLFRSELQDLGISKWVEVSSLSGVGLDQAVQEIVSACDLMIRRDTKEVLLTRLDQLVAVRQALLHLERAQNAQELEFFAADIRHCLHALSPLIGQTLSDDILGKIFSEFCIGK